MNNFLSTAFSLAQNRTELRPCVFTSAHLILHITLLFFPVPPCFISWFSVQKINFANFFELFQNKNITQTLYKCKSSMKWAREELNESATNSVQRYLSWCWLHQRQHEHDQCFSVHHTTLYLYKHLLRTKAKLKFSSIVPIKTAININWINIEPSEGTQKADEKSDGHHCWFDPSCRREYPRLLDNDEKYWIICSLCKKFKPVGANGRNFLKDTQRFVYIKWKTVWNGTHVETVKLASSRNLLCDVICYILV